MLNKHHSTVKVLVPLATQATTGDVYLWKTPSSALWPVQAWMMAYSCLLSGIRAEVLHCGLGDERLLMLIPLPTTVSPTSLRAGSFFIV